MWRPRGSSRQQETVYCLYDRSQCGDDRGTPRSSQTTLTASGEPQSMSTTGCDRWHHVPSLLVVYVNPARRAPSNAQRGLFNPHCSSSARALSCSALVEVAAGLGPSVENTRFVVVFGLTQGHRPQPLSARDAMELRGRFSQCGPHTRAHMRHTRGDSGGEGAGIKRWTVTAACARTPKKAPRRRNR